MAKTKENSNLRKSLSIEQIVDLKLNQKKSINEISLIVGASAATLNRFCREHNIKLPRRDLSKESTLLEVKKEILAHLKQGLSVTNICKKCRINHNTYAKILHLPNKKKASNSINEDVVTLSNPQICYTIGFFIADGHMDKKTLYLSQCDANILHKIQKVLGHKGLLKKVSGNAIKNVCYALHINSPRLRSILEEHNVASNKKLSAPYIECNNYDTHFMRGLFDGDGNLYYNYTSGKLKERRVSISTGSPYVMEGVVKFMQKYKFEPTVVKTKVVNVNYEIFIDKIDEIIRFLELLYKDSNNLFLSRKYISFIKFKKLVEMNNQVNDIVDDSKKLDVL